MMQQGKAYIILFSIFEEQTEPNFWKIAYFIPQKIEPVIIF